MNIENTSVAPPSLTQEADAALRAITDQAKASNLATVAELAETINEAHVAEHIRGMVAATMGHLSAETSAATRNNAVQWREWALGVADGVERGVPAAA